MARGNAHLLTLRERSLDLRRPRVMGVLNLTPDSFHAPSRLAGADAARERALAMVDAGADLLDLGGMSSRPGAETLSPEEELSRLLPALEAVRAAVAVPLSVDTFQPAVAARAVEAGADLLNDITGLQHGDALARIAARDGLGLVVMHMRGTPQTMQQHTDYDDVVAEVVGFLAGAVARAEGAGVDRRRVIVDPGIGFAKTAEHNIELLGSLDALADLGQPVLVGASRKSFIGKLLGAEPGDRLPGSLAAAAAAVMGGAAIIRAHDVAETVQAVRLAGMIRESRQAGAGSPAG